MIKDAYFGSARFVSKNPVSVSLMQGERKKKPKPAFLHASLARRFFPWLIVTFRRRRQMHHDDVLRSPTCVRRFRYVLPDGGSKEWQKAKIPVYDTIFPDYALSYVECCTGSTCWKIPQLAQIYSWLCIRMAVCSIGSYAG